MFPTHCDPMDCSLLGFSVHEITLAGILDWVAIFFSIYFNSLGCFSKTAQTEWLKRHLFLTVLDFGRPVTKVSGEESLPPCVDGCLLAVSSHVKETSCLIFKGTDPVYTGSTLITLLPPKGSGDGLVTQSRSTLCDPMDCSMPGFPALHHLLEFAQTNVHGVEVPSNHPTSRYHHLGD